MYRVSYQSQNFQPCICHKYRLLTLQFVKVLQAENKQQKTRQWKKTFKTSMEPPTNCVADNNSANLAFMAIATTYVY